MLNEDMIVAVVIAVLQINPKEKQKESGLRTHGLCGSAAVSYEDPYIGRRPICWVHLNPFKGMKHRMKMM